MNLGGVNVLTPSTPADAKGLLKTAIRGRNPSFFLEPSGRGGEVGDVPDGEHLVPFGRAAVRREGGDVTVLSIGRMVKPALAAADALAGQGVSVEVIDPRTLVPFDEARECCGAASQIAAVVAEKAFHALEGPIRRVTTPNVAMPYAPNAERHVIPGEERIVAAVLSLAGRTHKATA